MALSRRAQRRIRGKSHGQQEFASYGQERERPSTPARRNTSTGKRGPRPGDIDEAAEREADAQSALNEGESGFGHAYGQGFGVSGLGLEGQRLEERDYRGNAGTTFGAPVGPDALKQDTSQDQRDDPKPDQ